MKKIITLFVFLATFTGLLAQNLVVRDFKPLPLDQTAINRATMKKDQNGKTAALIKIYTTLDENQVMIDNGVMGVVAKETMPGQIWLYIPSRSQALQIACSKYLPISYTFEEDIQPGMTYSMILTVEGKEVTLSASVRQAMIYVDGEPVGPSPQNKYLSYGEHAVRAEKGSMLYDGDIQVSKSGPSRFELPMEDENLKYSDVTVSTPDHAEIYFQGERVGVGEWKQRLRSGHYSVDIRKHNYEERTISFDAKAGQPTVVDVPALVPYRGFLNVSVIPNTGTKIMDGDTVVALHSLQKQLNVGDYTYTFRKKGYIPITKSFSIQRNESTNDTVTLQRIQYIRENALYAGLGFSYSSIYGVGIHVGGVYHNINLELGYTLGLGKSNTVYWYEMPKPDGLYSDNCTYTTDEFELKAGYQFSFVERLGLIPQVGYMGQRLRGGTHGNGAMSHNLTVGARLVFNPLPSFGIFVNPEYAIPVSVNNLYKEISEYGGFSKGGFFVSAGITFNF